MLVSVLGLGLLGFNEGVSVSVSVSVSVRARVIRIR